MKIKYLGHSSFLIKGKTDTEDNVSVVSDPFNPKMLGIPYPKQNADVVTLSHATHEDHSYLSGISGEKGKDYFYIDTPGEYETRGLRVIGVKSYHDNKKGAERGLNTIYVFDFSDLRVVHLGDLGHMLESDQLESIEAVDILMIPVGGVYTINPEEAVNVIETLEPKIVIPMHYKTDKSPETFGKLATLEDFLKEYGAENSQTNPELQVKSKSDLPIETTVYPLQIN